MTKEMVVLVTGANRGIGLAICRSLLVQSPNIVLYATSRAGKELGLNDAAGDGDQKKKVYYPQLDVTDPAAIRQLARDVESRHGFLDILVNNAGINTLPEHNPSAVRSMLDTNYRGTLNMCLTFLPLLTKEHPKLDGSASSPPLPSRIVNLSSIASSLHIFSPGIRSRFRDTNLQFSDLDKLANEYQQAVEDGAVRERGFGREGQGYCVSKACVNALTAILARQEQTRDTVLINCCCPGWVDTDLGSIVGKAPKSAEDGAKIPVRLAIGDIKGVNGRYWANESIADPGDGKVMEW